MKQAYLLKLFSNSSHYSKLYPAPNDKQIKIFIPRGKWSLLDKDLTKFSERQLKLDYKEWQKEFLEYPNAIDYRDVKSHQNELIFYCSDFNLQNLIDVKTPSFLNVNLSFNNQSDLFVFQNILSEMDLIENFNVQEFNNKYAFIKIKYFGKINKIKEKLIEKDIDINFINNQWHARLK